LLLANFSTEQEAERHAAKAQTAKIGVLQKSNEDSRFRKYLFNQAFPDNLWQVFGYGCACER
jgi:hypothetical protein